MSASSVVPSRKLGKQGLVVPALGLGCMGMSFAYITAEESKAREGEHLELLDHVFKSGINFLDSADVYGPFTNEELIGKAIKGRRDQVIIATKFGFKLTAEGLALDCTRAYTRSACEASLARLGIDCIDLYYQHRVDPKTPIEETMAELKLLVEEGKIKYIGLSECSADEIRRAHKIHPITAYQVEWSIWTRHAEKEIVPTCRELGIGIVAYSPLGRGFLTGALESRDDLKEGDWRLTNPRFAEEAMERNKMIVGRVKALAEKKGCTSAQIAIAWVLHQGEDVVPIPGTKKVKYFEDNLGALKVKLTPEELATLDIPETEVTGSRF